MSGFLIALISGILMSVQGVFNTGLTKQTSLWTCAAFVQFSALLVCLGAWWISDRSSFMKITAVRPGYLLLGGIMGAFITLTVVVSMNNLGPAKSVMFIVISQLISAYLIELLGWFGVEKQDFSIRRMVGMAIAVAGVMIFKWK